MLVVRVFFFKQKTAYEMRISDWSSDVCSSDLLDVLELRSPTDYRLARLKAMRVYHAPLGAASTRALERVYADLTEGEETRSEAISVKGRIVPVRWTARGVAWFNFAELCGPPLGAEDYIRLARRYHTRSEEPTSEL